MSKYDEFPRTDLTYCYVCNGHVITQRFEGDRQKQQEDFLRNPTQPFVKPGDLDIQSVTCSEKCLQAYRQLPRIRYYERKVPLLEGIDFDGGPLSGFPQRNGQVDGVNENAIMPVDIRYRHSTEKVLEPLFQAWLFFGYLHEVLGDHFDPHKFIVKEESGDKSIVLTPLSDVLQAWMLSMIQQENLSSEHMNHLQNASLLVNRMLRATIGFNFNNELRCFIISAAEVIWKAIGCLYPDHTLHTDFGDLEFLKVPGNPDQANYNRSRFETLLHRMPSMALRDTYRCLMQEKSDSAVDETPKFNERQAGATHRSKCSGLSCNVVRVNELSMQGMCEALDQGTFPLISFRQESSGSISIDVIPWKKHMKFVAISHVWAHGMGNEADNSLQQCYVDYLHQCVKNLWQVIDSGDSSSPLIWFDTFCCPITDDGHDVGRSVTARAEHEFKILSHLMMRTVYKMATAVLVIDAGIERVATSSVSPVELTMHIVNSDWMHRLWTLQEGALPEELWFQFRDHPLNTHSIFLALRDGRRSISMKDRIVANHMVFMIIAMRSICGRYAYTSQELEIFHMADALSQRSVKYECDEPVCVATLFNLEASTILADPSRELRMKAIWQQMSDRGLVPRKMAFAMGKKLCIPGFSWAWSTFLQQAVMFGLARGPSPVKGIATENGLLINASGVSIKAASPLAGFDAQYYLGSTDPPLDYFMIDVGDNRWCWFHLRGLPIHQELGNENDSGIPILNMLRFSGKTFALVRYYLPTDTESDDHKTLYLLVETLRIEEGVILCKRVHIGALQTMPTPQQELLAIGSDRVNELRKREDFQALSRFEGHSGSEDDVQSQKLAHQQLWSQIISERLRISHTDNEKENENENALRGTTDAALWFRIIHNLAGQYAFVEGEFPDTQRWVID